MKSPLVPVALVLFVLSGCAAISPDKDADGSGSKKREISQDAGIDQALPSSNIFDLFNPPNVENTILVNRYIWTAALEVLNFLPIDTVDPFTGVIVTGFGTPPNGGRAYRATVLIDDPALDARSLNVALQSRNGPVDPATVRAIEDAILTRARQLRIADGQF